MCGVFFKYRQQLKYKGIVMYMQHYICRLQYFFTAKYDTIKYCGCKVKFNQFKY